MNDSSEVDLNGEGVSQEAKREVAIPHREGEEGNKRNTLWQSHPWHMLRMVWETLVFKLMLKALWRCSNGDVKVVMLRRRR